MSGLPERYQRYAQLGQQPVQPAEIELHGERDPIVWTTDAYGQPVQMLRSQLPVMVRPEPRDLTPQPLIDPIAARMAGAGIGVGTAGAGVGWGIGQAASGIAAMGGVAAVVAMLALWLLARSAGGRGGTRIEVHNHASWFGRNTTNL